MQKSFSKIFCQLPVIYSTKSKLTGRAFKASRMWPQQDSMYPDLSPILRSIAKCQPFPQSSQNPRLCSSLECHTPAKACSLLQVSAEVQADSSCETFPNSLCKSRLLLLSVPPITAGCIKVHHTTSHSSSVSLWKAGALSFHFCPQQGPIVA